MKIKIPNWLEKDINIILLYEGKNFLQGHIEAMVRNAKKDIFVGFMKDYIQGKMTAKEYRTLTNNFPTKEMYKLRLNWLKKEGDSSQEKYYLKILAEDDRFGYADEYFREIIDKVETEN